MGCGASKAQVSAEEGVIDVVEEHEGDGHDDQIGAESNGLQHDLELADLDRSSVNFTQGDGRCIQGWINCLLTLSHIAGVAKTVPWGKNNAIQEFFK